MIIRVYGDLTNWDPIFHDSSNAPHALVVVGDVAVPEGSGGLRNWAGWGPPIRGTPRKQVVQWIWINAV